MMRSVQSVRRLVAFLLSLLGALTAWPASAQTNSHSQEAPATPPAGGFVDGIVAVVGKDVITLRELRLRTEQVKDGLARQHIQPPEDTVLQRQVLQRVIQERLEDQEAARLNIGVSDEQVQQAIQTIAARNQISVESMRQQIEEGTNWDEYQRTLYRDILHDRLRQRVIDHTITITDNEVQAFLKEQEAQRGIGALAGRSAPEAGRQPDMLALAQILVRVPESASPQQVAALRRKADDLLARARRGEDFAALAAASSDGSEALEGGMMGARPAGGWPDLFLNAVGTLSPGQVADVIQSGNGFHILKVVDRQSAARSAGPAGPGAHPAQLYQRVVQGGENFADLARRFSTDTSAPQGGDLGWLNPGETVPAFEEAMNSLQEGQVSEPIQSPFGWHLIMVEARRVHDMADEFQRMQARQTLFERRAQPAFENWLDQLRDQVYIDNRLEKREQLEQAL